MKNNEILKSKALTEKKEVSQKQHLMMKRGGADIRNASRLTS